VTWSQASPDFEPDGGLRDIYVRNVGPSGWENVYHWLLDTYPHVFLRDGVEVEPPLQSSSSGKTGKSLQAS